MPTAAIRTSVAQSCHWKGAPCSLPLAGCAPYAGTSGGYTSLMCRVWSLSLRGVTMLRHCLLADARERLPLSRNVPPCRIPGERRVRPKGSDSRSVRPVEALIPE